jgi:ankyrin repeat protein
VSSLQDIPDLVNAQGGDYGSALHAASAEGHKQIVKLLLEKGADVNVQGGHYGSALQAASVRDHEEVVKLLLEKGADVNAQSGDYGSALHAALARGHEEIVKLLLSKGAGADVGALYASSDRSQEQVVNERDDQVLGLVYGQRM